MFGGKFNANPFNGRSTTIIYLSFAAHAVSDVSARSTVTFASSARCSSASAIYARPIRLIVGSVSASGAAFLRARANRVRYARLHAGGTGRLRGRAQHLRNLTLIIPGIIPPGAKVVVDSRNFYVTINDQPVEYSGDFFDIHPDRNEIKITTAAGKVIRATVRWRDRFL